MLRALGLVGAGVGVALAGGAYAAAPAPVPSPSPVPIGAVPLANPVASAVQTQGYGCTSFELEPYSAACPTHHFHSGVDLAAPLDTPVLAAETGLVEAAEWSNAGYGQFVLLDHGAGLQTLYAHLDELEVAPGDFVFRGAEIGKLGSTGFSTGPHLHFEVRTGGRPTDPSPYLAAGITKGGKTP
ncbi:MAG TPA: M23 family metallopeptidase [Candidatus Dormibacteraeota bacterium]